MADCNNPRTPTYNKLNPISPNKNCGGSGSGVNIILPPISGGGGKSAEVLAGTDMVVDDISDLFVDRFIVNYAPYEAVAVSLGLIPRFGGSDLPQPVLKGSVIDEVFASWNYNPLADAVITIQTLSNSFSFPDPSLLPTDREYSYEGTSLTGQESVTIEGTDGRTSSSRTATILFGNYLAIGVTTPSMLSQSPTTVQVLFDALASKTNTTTQHNVSFNAYGESDPPEYMVIAYPKSYGNSIFTKGTFSGGYLRMISTLRAGSPTWVTTLLGGEVELDVNIDNGNGFSEPYIFYQSEYPARTGENPTIITKA